MSRSDGSLVAVYSIHDIDDAMIERAAIAFYRVRQESGESLADWSKRQVRSALKAALTEPVGASPDLTSRGLIGA